MRITTWQALGPLFVAALSGVTFSVGAEQIELAIGRSAGAVGVGVSDAVRDSMYRNLPEWIDVAPRPKDDCLKESGGTINPTFVKCRNGYQQKIVRLSDGSVKVLDERPAR